MPNNMTFIAPTVAFWTMGIKLIIVHFSLCWRITSVYHDHFHKKISTIGPWCACWASLFPSSSLVLKAATAWIRTRFSRDVWTVCLHCWRANLPWEHLKKKQAAFKLLLLFNNIVAKAQDSWSLKRDQDSSKKNLWCEGPPQRCEK